ncbi:hypothetical protein Tco_1261204, partial [Tanacetum coccineum]
MAAEQPKRAAKERKQASEERERAAVERVKDIANMMPSSSPPNYSKHYLPIRESIWFTWNGFKTSDMRLGADVLVFTRNRGQDFG